MTCLDGSCRITIPLSPREIRDTYDVDVFAGTVGALTYPAQPSVITSLVDMCWRRFRDRPIGDYDYERWLEALDDKVNLIWYAHKRTIALLLDANVASVNTVKETVTETVTTERDASTVNDSTRTDDLTRTDNLSEAITSSQNTAGTVGNVKSASQTGTNTVESEDNPDTAAGLTKYLSNKTVTTPDLDSDESSTDTTDMDVTASSSRGNTGTVKDSGTVKDTGSVTVNDDTTVSSSLVTERADGLQAINSLDVYTAIREGVDKFVNDLEPLFLNRW